MLLVAERRSRCRRTPRAVPGHDHDAHRQGHAREEAAPHRLAVADRDRVAVRDRGGPQVDRRRRPVRLPEGGAEDDALRLHAERRGDRRLPAGPRRHRVRPEGPLDALRRLGITVVHHDGARTFAGAYQQIRQLGLVTGHATEARRARSRGMRAEDRQRSCGRSRPTGARLSVYHELDPDLFSATSKTFVGKVYAALGLRNIADAADSTGTGYPQLSAEYVVASSPDVIVLADSVCCGQKPSTVAARPGWDRISAVRTGSIVAHRRLDRVALGTAARELLPGDVLRARAPAVGADDGRRRAGDRGVRARGLTPALGGGGGRLPARLARRRRRSSARSTSASARSSSRAAAKLHVPGAATPLTPTEEAILWEIRVPRVVLARARRRDARPRGGDVPGRVPEPARRPVSARRRGRGGPRRDDRDRVPPRGPARAARAPAGRLRRGSRRGRAHLCGRALGEARARRRDPRPRGRDRRGVLHGLADVRPAAERGDAAAGVHVDPREHSEHGLVGRRADPPVRRRRGGRDPRAPARRRRPQPRGRRGGEPRRRRPPRPARPRRRGDARDRRGGRGQRPHRLRRDHRPARDPARSPGSATARCSRSR